MSDTFNYLKAGEKPDPRIMLGRLSEIGKCLLTGETDGLTVVPVDMNPNNILASNMAQVSKAIAAELEFTYYYDVEIGPIQVTFDTAEQFEPYNTTIAEAVKLEEIKIDPEMSDPLLAISTFDLLTARHCKGLCKVKVRDVVVDRDQYFGYLLRQLAKSQQSGGIIKPSGLVGL